MICSCALVHILHTRTLVVTSKGVTLLLRKHSKMFPLLTPPNKFPLLTLPSEKTHLTPPLPKKIGPFKRALSGPIRASRFSLRKKKLVLFANRPSRKWIAASKGRKSREVQCESERRHDSRESGQVLQK